MSVRKRKWITSKGEEREAWVVDYTDMQGDRHVETFAKKKDADARHAEVRVDVRAGVHVALSKSITVTDAGKSWIRAAEAAELERSTVKQYREHVDGTWVPCKKQLTFGISASIAGQALAGTKPSPRPRATLAASLPPRTSVSSMAEEASGSWERRPGR